MFLTTKNTKEGHKEHKARNLYLVYLVPFFLVHLVFKFATPNFKILNFEFLIHQLKPYHYSTSALCFARPVCPGSSCIQ